MPASAPPDNEPQRLAAVHALHVLDTPAEEAFDRLAQLARELFDVPVALITLLDEQRQWFKSHPGFDICQTPRDIAFCDHTITADAPLVVPDTHRDVRFMDNRLVVEPPHIRFYAGYPLRPHDQLAVGSLCLLDHQPREFSERDMGLLKSLAGQVEELLRQHQMRYTLAQTTRRYEALFNESATGIVRINRDGTVLGINPFALKLLGYTRDEVLGRNVAMLTPPDLHDRHDSFIARFLAGGRPQVVGRGREVEAQHKAGHRVPVHLAVNAIDDEHHQVAEFIGILTDLRQIHAANQRIQKEQSLLKVLHQGITDYPALMSGKRLWIFLMEALRELTDSDYALIGEVIQGDTGNALKLHAITDLSWSSESQQVMEQLASGDMVLKNPNSLLGRVFSRGKVVIDNNVNASTQRSEFPLGQVQFDNYLGVPIFSHGQLIGMYAIANSRQPLNRGLLDWLQPFTDTCVLLINLYRQMAEREQVMQDLAAARDQAEQANQAKSDFLSSMSHELRTPLNAILGFAQLLASNTRTPLNAKQQRQVRQIEKSGQHLLSLINDVLDLAKIEARQLSLSIETISLAGVFDDACSTLEASTKNAGIALSCTLPDAAWRVHADYTRTKQILLNLLSNAMKYNVAHGRIELSAEHQQEQIKIRVRDTGPGVDPARLDELFEPFNRLDAEDSTVEGTGIGLSITRELVEQMHGRIGVDSQPGQGATFWFTLPVATPAAASSPREPQPDASSAPLSSPTLLYIEDNPANQRLMEDIVDAMEGITLRTASSAELGLDMLQAERPAVVLMDLHLPGMGGYEALAHLRRDPRYRHLPVIALSANALPRDVRQGLNAGFDDYLKKPIDIAQLSDTLHHLLGAPTRQEP
ncbi:ATP-binding protein [Halomonas sp. CUBES01]|uniref:histidine kinase n=1 Tax=Vreelandella gomseomensis TaxID=370766 RepID=A0ABU1G8A6_9GAMM|nr:MULTISPECIES: ATP-binding protein [Halomonas]MDR5873507.1 ATP-binding protein [Halomonas gomseomensis]MEC4768264.1 ATP-binding protein [Halomonas sp. CUBES01]